MKIILDTNFILSCVKAKVDFLETEKYGKLLIPEEVIIELKKIEKDKKEGKNAKLCLKIIKENKDKFEVIKLGFRFVDKGIIDFINKNSNIALATLDKELKKKIENKARILTLRARKKIEFA